MIPISRQPSARFPLIARVGVIMRLQFGGRMDMIVRLQHVVGVIVLVTLFACRMIVAVAVLVRVRMDVRMRVLMAVNLCAVTMLMPVGVAVFMLMLMSVLVTSSHRSVSFALCPPLSVGSRAATSSMDTFPISVRRWRAACNSQAATAADVAGRAAGLPR
jgi:hypothetical protein